VKSERIEPDRIGDGAHDDHRTVQQIWTSSRATANAFFADSGTERSAAMGLMPILPLSHIVRRRLENRTKIGALGDPKLLNTAIPARIPSFVLTIEQSWIDDCMIPVTQPYVQDAFNTLFMIDRLRSD